MARKEQLKRANRKYALKSYNLTLQEYDNILRYQNGRCAICGEKEIKRCFAIDHNHKTGEVRGLLCVCCNLGLGAFKDDPHLLLEAIQYLLPGFLDESK